MTVWTDAATAYDHLITLAVTSVAAGGGLAAAVLAGIAYAIGHRRP